MGLNDIEWWEGPDSDDDILIIAARLEAARYAPPITRWKRQNNLVKTLWWIGMFVALAWAGTFGMLALVCLIPPLTPLGLLLMPYAGGPVVALWAWRTGPHKKEKA